MPNSKSQCLPDSIQQGEVTQTNVRKGSTAHRARGSDPSIANTCTVSFNQGMFTTHCSVIGMQLRFKGVEVNNHQRNKLRWYTRCWEGKWGWRWVWEELRKDNYLNEWSEKEDNIKMTLQWYTKRTKCMPGRYKEEQNFKKSKQHAQILRWKQLKDFQATVKMQRGNKREREKH